MIEGLLLDYRYIHIHVKVYICTCITKFSEFLRESVSGGDIKLPYAGHENVCRKNARLICLIYIHSAGTLFKN